MNKMRIGIFGGTFNPIHIGHLIIADDIRIQAKLDKIIFVPSGNPPHKDAETLLDQHTRYCLIECAIEGNINFHVDNFEINRSGYSYTIDTMTHFQQCFPDEQLFFIIGADSLFEIHLWKDAERLLEKFSFLIAQRRGNPISDSAFDAIPLPKHLKEKLKKSIVNPPVIDVSATQIRNRIQTGESIWYLVPDKVRNYIENYHLYSNGGVS